MRNGRNLGDYITDLFNVGKKFYQRGIALFLFLIMLWGIVVAPATAVAATLQNSASTTSANTPMKQNYPGPLVSPSAGASKNVVQTNDTLQSPRAITFKQEELTDKRTAFSDTTRNTDGSYTERQYMAPHYYQQNGSWQPIDTSLAEDTNAGDAGNIVGQTFGWVESLLTSPTAYIEKANGWQARFAPSDFSKGMVRVEQNGQQVGFSPVNAGTVAPVITTDSSGRQTVHYYNLWPNIDVEYTVNSDSVKESIVIKNKDAAASVQFRMIGADLKAKTVNGLAAFDINALDNSFSIAPLSLILNNFGYATNKTGLVQSYSNGTLSVSLDKQYLSSLPAAAFPAVIDPTVTTRYIGDRSGGNYVSMKSDGYVCPSTSCNPQAGSLQDSSYVWRSWRSAFFAQYQDILQGHILQKATLHLTRRTGVTWYTGDSNNHWFRAWRSSCNNGYNCYDGNYPSDTALIGNSGDIDVTNIYQALMNNNNWGSWLFLTGEETAANTYKNFDPDHSATYVSFTWANYTPTPSMITPSASQVFVDPQVSFQSTAPTNPNSGTPLKYNFCVSNAPGCSGAVMMSGDIDSPQWTIPDGVLQDGTTYYVQVRAYDPDGGGGYSSYSSAVQFKIDARTGKDKTQTYDTLGPISADLATGNVSTGTTSHTASALGGSLGVSLDYNSPARARTGLTGQYFSNTSFSGTPVLTRIDRNIDFNWSTGSPASGVFTSPDNFSAKWTGYFVAPASGAYYFGGNNDDSANVIINGQNVYSNTNCASTVCYGASAITLSAGQVVPIEVDYIEYTGNAFMKLWTKGPVPEGAVPSDWLRTDARPLVQHNGLSGHYYYDNGSHDFGQNTQMFMQRNDSLISYNWGLGSPVPQGPVDNFLVRWNGYITVPVTGNYQFGTISDDGSRVTIGTNNTTALSKWYDDGGNEVYGTSMFLTANQPVPITVDFYEHGGGAEMYLKVQGAVANQVVPSSWLSPRAQVLPDGWNLGIDPDGNLSYDHLSANPSSVILTDSTGDTHEYLWKNNGYTPPTNEDGHLVKNADGTYTLQDTDGRTYTFNTQGVLTGVTSPTDDLHPAALKYTYAGSPAHISQIIDGVDPARTANVYYSGDTNCGTAPSGFDAQAPAGMLCAVKTYDGRATNFYYSNGQLARVARPGNDFTDYQYDTLGRIITIRDSLANDAIAAGVRTADGTELTQLSYDILGRVTGVTQPAATPGAARLSQTIEYLPGNGSYTGATQEHVTDGAEPNGFTRRAEYDSLLRTTKDTDTANLSTVQEWDPTKDLLLSTTDATGLKSTTIYDPDDRPVQQYGPAPAAWYNADRTPQATYASQVPRTDSAYDQGIIGPAVAYMASNAPTAQSILYNGQTMVKGNSLWSLDRRFQFAYQTDSNLVLYGPNGVMWASNTAGKASTFLGMQSDGNLVLYNGSTAVWNTGTNGGNTSYLTVQNDGNLVVWTATTFKWTSYTGGWPAGAPANISLSGAPKLHSTNIANDGTISKNFGLTSPIPSYSGYWGLRMTGKLRLPSTGTYNFRIVSDGGVRMWVDDKLVIDDWYDGGARSHPAYTFTETVANKPHRVQIDYFHTTLANNSASFTLYVTPPGGGETANTAAYFSPDYSLQTSSTTYDSSLGNTTATTGYGSNPELGLAAAATADTGGLNLISTSTYEAPGSGFLRQTSSSLPGGATTSYSYYGATETRQNPCDTTQTYRQAGMVKAKTEPSPDNGTTPGRSTETVYDDAGNIVASRYNQDAWTCISYDTRGRIASTAIPSFNSQPARTIINNFAVGGNPLVVSTTDAQGTITTTADLLGRTVSYTDVYGNTTTTSYDNLGRVANDTSPLGTEAYTYNNYNQMLNQTLDGTAIAQPLYDQYGRLNHVWYPTTKTSEDITFDTFGNTAAQTFTLINGTVVSDAAAYSQSGKILTGTNNTGTGNSTWSYTYDKADRLTGASSAGIVGANAYSYGFGMPSGCAAGTNPNAGKDSNRTSLTKSLNGISSTTTYCYDYADRLVSSSDPTVDAAQYDTHGNTISLGSTGHVTTFSYDSSDRNSAITEGTKSVSYARDVTNRVVSRITNDGTTTTTTRYGFTGSGDTPDLAMDGSNNVTEKYLSLPGDMQLTIRPGHTDATAQTASLANIHGDTLATVDANGSLTGTFQYDPFGNLLGSSNPVNTANNASFGWEGQHEKLAEVQFALAPVQMGARVYLPTLGRFTSVDPVQGGTANNYAYVTDPVNDSDLGGTFSFRQFVKDNWKSIAVGAAIGLGCAASAGIGCAIAVGAVAGAAIGGGSYAFNHRKTGFNLASTAKAAGGGAISGAVSGAIGFGVGRVLGRVAYTSKGFGVSSKLFGNERFGLNGPGRLNNYGKLKIGWSHQGTADEGHAVFRMGFRFLAKNRHINILRGGRLW